jgi:AsmA protein
MKRLFKWMAIVIAVLIVAAVALSFFFDANRFRPTLEASLSNALHRTVKLGNLSLALFSGSVQADDLAVSDDPAFSKAPFLKAKAIRVSVELQPLIFSRKLNVTGITIEQPEIMLIQTPTGDWNFSSLGNESTSATAAKPANATTAAGEGMALTVSRLSIVNGRLTVGRTAGTWKSLVLENVNLEVKDFSAASSFPFSLTTKVQGGGDIKLDGKAGPLNPTDASMMPAILNVAIDGLDLAAAGISNYAPDVSGVVSIHGMADTNGSVLKANGAIKAEKLKLAKGGTAATVPLQLDFAAEHNLRKHSGQLKRGDIHIGKAAANLTGSYFEQGKSMMLKMNLDAPDMSVSEVAHMFGPLGIVLPAGSSLRDGSLSTKLSMEGPADKLVTSGSIGVRDTTLSGFDLGKKMAVIEAIAGINTGNSTVVQNASLNVQVSPGGIQAHDIQLNVPAVGNLRGEGSISPANALDFKMSVGLHTTGTASIIADKSIPFFVQGTSSEPVFKPDLKGIAREQVNSLKKDAGNTASELLKGILGGQK